MFQCCGIQAHLDYVYSTHTCTAHIYLLYKGTHVYSFTMKYNTIEFNISNTTINIKSICLLTCFLLAFSGFVQSVIYLNYANYLMSTQGSGKDNFKALVKKIKRAGECQLFGLRALYFALIFLLWFFGPIPMFVTSFILVIILYFHDNDTKDCDNEEDNQQANV